MRIPQPTSVISPWKGSAKDLVRLLELFQELTPKLMDAFEPIAQASGSPREAEAMRTAYATLPTVNFSQAILARCPHRLGVLRVQGV